MTPILSDDTDVIVNSDTNLTGRRWGTHLHAGLGVAHGRQQKGQDVFSVGPCVRQPQPEEGSNTQLCNTSQPHARLNENVNHIMFLPIMPQVQIAGGRPITQIGIVVNTISN